MPVYRASNYTIRARNPIVVGFPHETQRQRSTDQTGQSKKRTFETSFVMPIGKHRKQPKAKASQANKSTLQARTVNIGPRKPTKTSRNRRTTMGQNDTPNQTPFELVLGRSRRIRIRHAAQEQDRAGADVPDQENEGPVDRHRNWVFART